MNKRGFRLTLLLYLKFKINYMKTNGNHPSNPVDNGLMYDHNANCINEENIGLTKREYLAAAFCPDIDNMDKEYAEALAGYRQPQMEKKDGVYTRESLLSIAIFWADVKATLRVMDSDALIKALNKEVSNG